MDKITLEGIACGYAVTKTNQLPNGLKEWEGIAWFQNPCKPSIILKLKHRLLKYNNHIQRESGSVYATEFRWRENMMIGCKFEGAGPLVKWKDGPIPIIKKEKPKMKRTEIKYKEIGNDQIEILGFSNVTGRAGIENEFGQDVCSDYFSGVPYFSLNLYGYVWVQYGENSLDGWSFKVGNKLYTDHFQKIITTMKAAGQRLIDIRKEHAKPKTIYI